MSIEEELSEVRKYEEIAKPTENFYQLSQGINRKVCFQRETFDE
jgi:hypothetical protein